MDGKLYQMTCAITNCVSHRYVKLKSRLCLDHLITSILKLLRDKGKNDIGYQEIKDALEKKTQGLTPAAIRRVAAGIIKTEDKHLQERQNEKQ